MFLQQGNGKYRFNYLFGGAGSSKSWTIAQFLLIEKLYKEKDIGILALRKTKPEVKASCLRLVLHLLNQAELPHTENKTESIITAMNGNKFYFDSIDDVMKKKSAEGINYIWLEETTGFIWREWLQLNIRCRAKNLNGINQLFFSFNPEDPIGNEWLKNLTDKAPADTNSQVMLLNHGDNPFLSDEEREQIEALANQDEEYDKIYRQGLWATPTQIIYTNWDIIADLPEDIPEIGYGLDFGFNNPTALIEVGIKEMDAYLDELLYQTKLTNQDLIDKLKELIPPAHRNRVIRADSAEPQRIQEIFEAGFNIHPCTKGKDSVKIGIDRCKRFKTHITQRSTNTIKEKKGYKWRVDKDGNVLDEPVKFRNHAMDAERYYLGEVMIEEPELVVLGEYDL